MGFFKKIMSPIVWGNIIAIVVVAVLVCMLALKGIDVYTHHGESIEVPAIVGMQESDAQYTLQRLELVLVKAETGYDKSKPTGCVLAQNPESGTKVKAGRQIYVTINASDSPTRALPDIADNSSLREAEAKLTAMGFKLGPVEYVSGDLNWVYGVKSRGRNVYAGERVPLDIPLVLQVGKDANGDDYDELDDFGEPEEGEGLDDLSEPSTEVEW
jgi:hypothetical protein